MKFSIRSGILAIIFCAGIVGAGSIAYAEEPDEEVVTQTLISENPGSFDDEELFAEYFQQTIEESVDAEETMLMQQSYDAKRYAYLNEQEQALYNYWYAKINEIAKGSTSSAKIYVPLNVYTAQFSYTAAELGISGFDVPTDVIENALKAQITPDLYTVYMALLSDCPYELYWHDKTVGVDTGFNVNYTIASNGVEDVLTMNPDAQMLLFMRVSSDYATGKYTTNLSKTQAAVNTATNAKRVVNAAAGKSDYQKLVYYRDWIQNNVSYNYDAVYTPTSYGNPWQMIYVFDGDSSTNVTCEGYSKAFKYLCDLSSFANSDIDCYLMTGTMKNEDHMWNVVFMDDKQNYLVDVTNFDSAYPKDLFLSGYSSIISNGYAFTCSGSKIDYVYDADTLGMYSTLERTIAPYNYGTQVTPKDPIEAFVTRAYRVVLQREPDAAGLADWTSQLRSGKKTASQVILGFYLSKEMLGRNLSNSEYVESVYLGLFDRASDANGKAHWVEALDNGMSYQYILYGFNYSQEFEALCARYGMARGDVTLNEARDQNVGLTAFVNRLYNTILDRNSETDGLNNWCGSILADSSRDHILWVATNGFLHSNEFMNRNLNNADYVKVLYQAFLGRRYDDNGLQYWVNQLNQGVSRDSIAWGFANSQEFNDLMTSYGL